MRGKPKSEEHKANIKANHSHFWKGKLKPLSEQAKKKISIIRTGTPRPELLGDKNPNWKGGITPINKVIRASIPYKQWRTQVFERDNYTCVWCGNKESGNLNADHIQPFAYYPELRFELSNGRTLCVPCHKTTDTYLNRYITTNPAI